MLTHPILVSLILLAVVAFAIQWSRHRHSSKWMRLFPTPVWCYIPPTILTTAGILPMQSPVYDWISNYCLPACLILLLMNTQLKAFKTVGRMLVIANVISIVSVLLGGFCMFFVFRHMLGAEAWNAIGTISGSWIGGTANMVAIKQATGLSEESFVPLFISDITVVYIWMMLLMMLSGSQSQLNRMLNASQTALEQISQMDEAESIHSKRLTPLSLVLLPTLGFGLALLIIHVSQYIPEIGSAVTNRTWVIILVTTVGLMLAPTSLAKKEGVNTTKIGYFLLYLVLAATGAKANLFAIFKAPFFLLMGFMWLGIHAGFLWTFGRLFRIPIAILASASQANLGGVASGPIVASTYEPKLVPAALILAIFGNAAGNYLGLLLAYTLRTFG